MFKLIKNIYLNFKENIKLKKENEELKKVLLSLDPQFKVLPFNKVLDFQTWNTKDSKKITIEMGYYMRTINEMKHSISNNTTKEALYIILRKITSEQLDEIKARDFIYNFCILLEIADDIPKLEMEFQKIIGYKNIEAMRKYSVKY